MFNDTMQFKTDNPVNAMAVSRDGLLAVAGRSLLKVYNLCGDETGSLFGQELFNLRSSNLKNLNFSNSDVTWCPLDNDILATAATNGAVVVWNLQCLTKSKIGVVYNDHKRTVNKVCFHSNDPNLLLSGSQDGCMKLFDLRKKEAVTTFVSNSESVRDVQFSPHWTYHFASVQETGNVEIWDIRKQDRPECNFIAHDGPVLSCEWHPNQENYKWLATGGRDKIIKVWDLSNRNRPQLIYNVHTITPVSKLKWRPEKDFHIGSCSLVVDFSVYVWDIKRPYVPFAIFGTKKDVTTGLAWKNDPFVFISSCKDGTIYQHRFETDAYYPAEHYPPIGIDFNPFGDIAFSTTDFIYRHSQTLSTNSNLGSNRMIKTFVTNNSFNNNNIVQSNSTANLNHSSLSSSLTQDNIELSHNNSTIINDVRPTTRHISIGSPSNHAQQYILASGGGGQPKYFPSYQQQQTQQISSLSSTTSSYTTPAYNISVPISYRKTNETILADHFRCMISYMMLFESRKLPQISACLTDEISMKNFIHSAKKYLLMDRTFEELCEHNAQVSDSLNRCQIAQTWRMIRHMFSIAGRHPTSSGGGGGGTGGGITGGGNNPSGGSLQNSIQPINDSGDYKMKNDIPSRHASGGGGGGGPTRHFSGNNNMNNNQYFQKESRNSDDDGDDNRHRNDNNNDQMELFQNHFPTLKQDTMPSNKFVVDFFDYQPNQLETMDSIEQRSSLHYNHYYNHHHHHNHRNDEIIYDYESNCQDWELQRESIFHRHNIAEYGIQMNEMNNTNNVVGGGGGDNSLMNNYEINSSISYDEDDELDFNLNESPGFSNANLQSLLSSKNPAPPVWPIYESVVQMLRFYVDKSDVQTACSIILVLGDRMKQIGSIDKQTIQIWFRSYIDLLHRFQLWNISTRLIQQCNDPDIQSINQSLTSVLVYCALCRKAIHHGSVLCEKCRQQPSTCSICHVSVRGLYVWCQGCAHGGHLKHMLEWFRTNLLCPAGCGHHCEMC